MAMPSSLLEMTGDCETVPVAQGYLQTVFCLRCICVLEKTINVPISSS